MYSTLDVAIAIGVDHRRLDNLITRYCRDTVPAGRRGSSRKISDAIVERLAVALLLNRDLRIPFDRGWLLSQQISAAKEGRAHFGALGTLEFDLPRLRTVVRQALADAVQDRQPVRRGRPVLKKKRGALL